MYYPFKKANIVSQALLIQSIKYNWIIKILWIRNGRVSKQSILKLFQSNWKNNI